MLVAERGLFIGQRLRDLRHEHALTQKELAKLAGVNEITISELENNKRTASARTLRKLAVAFGIEVREITSGAEMRSDAASEQNLPSDDRELSEENDAGLEATRRRKAELDEEILRERGARDTGDRAP